METTRVLQLKEDISKLSDEVEYLSILGVEGMLLGELLNNINELTSKSKRLNFLILELEHIEDVELNNSKLDDFREEY